MWVNPQPGLTLLGMPALTELCYSLLLTLTSVLFTPFLMPKKTGRSSLKSFLLVLRSKKNRYILIKKIIKKKKPTQYIYFIYNFLIIF